MPLIGSTINPMTVGESWNLRKKAAIANMVVIYAMDEFQNICRKVTKTDDKSSYLRQILVDTTSATTSVAAMYYGFLRLFAGKESAEAVYLALGGAVYIGLLGFPFKKVVHYTRKKMGLDK